MDLIVHSHCLCLNVTQHNDLVSASSRTQYDLSIVLVITREPEFPRWNAKDVTGIMHCDLILLQGLHSGRTGASKHKAFALEAGPTFFS